MKWHSQECVSSGKKENVTRMQPAGRNRLIRTKMHSFRPIKCKAKNSHDWLVEFSRASVQWVACFPAVLTGYMFTCACRQLIFSGYFIF